MSTASLRRRIDRLSVIERSTVQERVDAWLRTLDDTALDGLCELLAADSDMPGVGWRGDEVCEDAYRRAVAAAEASCDVDPDLGPLVAEDVLAACRVLAETVKTRHYRLFN